MTWQGSGGTGGREDPALDETQAALPSAEALVPAEVSRHTTSCLRPAAGTTHRGHTVDGACLDPGPSASPSPGITPGMSWAPPPSVSSPVVAGAAGLRYADVLPRFVAWFIDVLLRGSSGP